MNITDDTRIMSTIKEEKEGNEESQEVKINSFDQYKGKGLSGLYNLGNTCFINSCMQVLSHTYELNDFLQKKTYKRRLVNKPDSILLIEWDDLRSLLWQGNQTIKPSKFVYTIQKLARVKGANLFTGFSQNDVSEFFMFILDCFHTSISREVNIGITGDVVTDEDRIAVLCFNMMRDMYSKNYSEFLKLFFGTMVSQIMTTNVNGVQEELSIKAETYCTISLPLPSKISQIKQGNECSLVDCFNLFVEGEILSGENAYYNEKTKKKEEVVKKISFWSFPDILVIDLKRFNSSNVKNQILVTFPLERLDLSSYVVGYDKESYVYDLFGVCNHTGSSLGGHYTSFVKNANGKWYLYNDTNVGEVSHEYIISSKAYCLFYRKKTI